MRAIEQNIRYECSTLQHTADSEKRKHATSESEESSKLLAPYAMAHVHTTAVEQCDHPAHSGPKVM